MIADHTDLDDLRTALSDGPVTFYGGFDPTAPSLHFGNLVLLVTMRRLQQAGHRPIGLVGGATGLVGDPSGRSSERTLNDPQVIEGWVDRIRSQVERYLDFSGSNAAMIVNNLDWTAQMSAIDWLRDIGKHFSVSRMLAKEAVSARLEAGGISYTEFSYQIMQAVDYLELYRRHGCTLQLGGSDQWGNLTAGVDLIRRVEGVTAHALATPLITRPGWTEVREERGIHAVAGSGPNAALRVLPVVPQRRRLGRRHVPARVQLPLPRRDRGTGNSVERTPGAAVGSASTRRRGDGARAWSRCDACRRRGLRSAVRSWRPPGARRGDPGGGVRRSPSRDCGCRRGRYRPCWIC